MDKQKMLLIGAGIIILIGLGMWAMKGKDYKDSDYKKSPAAENSYGDKNIDTSDVTVEELTEDNLDDALNALDSVEGLSL